VQTYAEQQFASETQTAFSPPQLVGAVHRPFAQLSPEQQSLLDAHAKLLEAQVVWQLFAVPVLVVPRQYIALAQQSLANAQLWARQLGGGEAPSQTPFTHDRPLQQSKSSPQRIPEGAQLEWHTVGPKEESARQNGWLLQQSNPSTHGSPLQPELGAAQCRPLEQTPLQQSEFCRHQTLYAPHTDRQRSESVEVVP
jgi:hypothetical protein